MCTWPQVAELQKKIEDMATKHTFLMHQKEGMLAGKHVGHCRALIACSLYMDHSYIRPGVWLRTSFTYSSYGIFLLVMIVHSFSYNLYIRYVLTLCADEVRRLTEQNEVLLNIEKERYEQVSWRGIGLSHVCLQQCRLLCIHFQPFCLVRSHRCAETMTLG